MSAETDLDILSRRKLVLLDKISARREACALQIERVLRPVVWVEGLYAKWRAISPFVKIAAPLGLLFFKRKHSSKGAGMIEGLFRWAPMALKFFQSVR